MFRSTNVNEDDEFVMDLQVCGESVGMAEKIIVSQHVNVRPNQKP